jgi:hypothetical protein
MVVGVEGAASGLGGVTCVAPHQRAACAPRRRHLRFSETLRLATLRFDPILNGKVRRAASPDPIRNFRSYLPRWSTPSRRLALLSDGRQL